MVTFIRFNIFLTFIYIVFSANFINAQSDYKIDTFTIKYDTLTEYHSLVLENLINQEDWFVFEKELEFGFNFPYFDKSYSKALISSDGVFFFGDILGWYHIYALDNNWHTCWDPDNFDYTPHDYRYKLDMVNGKNVFKIEWHDIAICQTSWETATRPYNFQVWLWENGNIDFITGALNTTDTTIFKEGVGFIYEEGGSPGSIGIVNPKYDYALFYSGYYNSPKILEGNPDSILYYGRGILRSLPHEGFVVRFTKQTSATQDIKIIKPIPNIVTHTLNIPEDIIFNRYTIYNANGTLIQSGDERNISTSHFHSGLYFICLTGSGGSHIYKILKQ